MEKLFHISHDRALSLVRIVTSGFWSMDTVDQFTAELAKTAALAGSDCDCLVLSHRTDVQPPEVSDALGRLAQSGKDILTGRTAIVTSSTLLTMQTKRAMGGHERFGYFATEEEALAWLKAG